MLSTYNAAVELRRDGRRIVLLLISIALATLAALTTASFAQPAHIAVSPAGFPKAVIRGDYPDPSILREGADYYMVHSEYHYAPAFLIWHSTDLVNWTPIARALADSTGSLAPDLTKVNGKYYIYYPAFKTNFVTTADNIRGPWTKPVDVKAPRIDPGHIVGEDGKRYLFLSEGRMVQLSDDGLSAVGEVREAYAGWQYPKEWVTQCMCLESPKLFKKGEYFYMVSAEGGTAGPATSHMAVVARSKSVNGPWENSPYNPLVHTYSADDQWWSKGHGTIVDDVNGNWWMVHHAYEKELHTLGRMTLLDPIDWTSDGWPVLAKSPRPLPGSKNPGRTVGIPHSDDFSARDLGLQWISLRNLDGVTQKDGKLRIAATGNSPVDAKRLAVKATDPSYEVQVEVNLPPNTSGGLMLYYNEKAFVGVTSDGNGLSIYRSASEPTVQQSSYSRHFYLKIINDNEKASFLISRDGRRWDQLASQIDVSSMNHNNFRGFLSLRPSLIAAGSGEVEFDNFKYVAKK